MTWLLILMILILGYFIVKFDYYWFKVTFYSWNKVLKSSSKTKFKDVVKKHFKISTFNFEGEDKFTKEMGAKLVKSFKILWIVLFVEVLLGLLYFFLA